MAVTISRDNVFFAFSPQLKAIARIEQGQEVLLQTHDCFEGQIRTTSDLVDTLDWAHVNPATGPLYISGAKPGGVLRGAPAEGEVPTGTPGAHGGNMDCTLVAAGNRVYFTVGVEGALFGAGDPHAAMGDGGIGVCGAETAG